MVKSQSRTVRVRVVKAKRAFDSGFVNGEAALATALNASLKYGPEDSDNDRASRAQAPQRGHE